MAFGRAVRTTYLKRIDQAKTPWEIDLELDPTEFIIADVAKPTSESLQGGVMKGIFKFDKGDLVYCMALPGKPRPKSFATPKGSAHTLVRLAPFSTGEQAIEEQLKKARVSHYKDEIGWIVSVTLRDAKSAQLMPQIAKLKNLRTLHVTTDHLSDEQFETILGFKKLSNLKLQSEAVTDEDLKRIGHMESLVSVAIHSDQVTDKGIKHLANLKNVYHLRLKGTKVTDTGLKHLHSLTRLTSLQLDGTQVSDKGLSHLSSLAKLNHVQLSGTRVTDKSARLLTTLPRLQSLSLAKTAITDEALTSLGQDTALYSIDLSDTHVTDEGIRRLDRAKNLRRVHLTGTKITDAAIKQLAQSHPRLNSLYIGRNKQLTDKALEPLRGLKHLHRVYVSKGQFSLEATIKLKSWNRRVSIQER